MYDYWGYYNVCYLGAEIRDPARVIPRAILLSIARRRGDVPDDEHLDPRGDAVAGGREIELHRVRLHGAHLGPRAGVVVTILMLWTAFASVFSLLLGYSRVPYAAALDGDYFKVFARVHPKHHFPHVSLLVLGGAAICSACSASRTSSRRWSSSASSTQFLAQTLGIIVLRTRRPDLPRPFRMWLYPLPALLAFAGFVYIVIMRPKSIESIRLALLVVIVGTVLFWIRQRQTNHSS